MQIRNNCADAIKIAYIGGGSRAWAWKLMSDLALEKSLSGEVWLYDIDHASAMSNEIIGNQINELFSDTAKWTYRYAKTLESSLTGADFVVISILPGTLDEMASDVHAPEEYGIYQAVGDTTGPGGIVRALRTIPMFREFAQAIEKYCPTAYVINYTNPMTVCVKTLYEVFPQIRAVGCCHEVFGTKEILSDVLKEYKGITAGIPEIDIDVCGVNHFTWITKAHYANVDIYPLYRQFVKKHPDGFNSRDQSDELPYFRTYNKVKFSLFRRYDTIAAAGDRHLAEFCPKSWFLTNPEQASSYRFGLTPVSWRRQDYAQKDAFAKAVKEGRERMELKPSGEVGVQMIKALCGVGGPFKTNVNMPNRGQMSQAPVGAVVETNAVLTAVGIQPLLSTPLKEEVYALIARIIHAQNRIVRAGLEEDSKLALSVFCNDPLNDLSAEKSQELFEKMIFNTLRYLPESYAKKG